MASVDEILILMAVRDGARFLPGQLASIAGQAGVGWRLIVSDDGSRDGSAALLQEFAASQAPGRVVLLRGPGRGATENFRHLLRSCPEGALAFCDQDDVWHPEHLARAAAMIGGAGGPALYGCRMRITDAALRPSGHSPLPGRPVGFRNALVQNVFSGNGMVMNAEAARILRAAEAEAGPILLHDWWAYQLLSGAGARVVFDARPGLDYRQHGGNVVGANAGLAALPRRLWRHLRGAHGRWARLNVAALGRSAHRLSDENRAVLRDFAAALEAPPLRRLGLLRAAGVYHQRRAARAAFWISAALGLF
ncbi:MAG: glycosyltransferase [Paracoccaceae bacterium]